MNKFGFFDSGNTVVITAAGAGSSVVAVKRGISYRVISDVDAYIQYGAAAVVNAGVYLPAKTELWVVFAGKNFSDVDPAVAIYMSGAGHAYFTPCEVMGTF